MHYNYIKMDHQSEECTWFNTSGLTALGSSIYSLSSQSLGCEKWKTNVDKDNRQLLDSSHWRDLKLDIKWAVQSLKWNLFGLDISNFSRR